jgi:N-acetylglucosamine-6-phosphate deacetylase
VNDAIVHSARLVDDGRVVDDAWVAWADGRVTEIGAGDSWRSVHAREAIDAAVLAGPGAVLSAGFVDIHGHGGGGAAYDDGIDGIRQARRAHRAHGTTSAVVSLVAAPLPVLEQRVALVADLAATDPDVLGSHLEGPFLAPERRGAHDPAALAVPGPAVVAALLAAGRGTVRQVTIAPELPSALAAIETVVASGAAAAVGHTEADAATARRAFDAGATILTHAFNAMPGLHHRKPGPVGAAVADPRVTLELIADGTHVHPDVLRIALAAAAGRVALVTDAMAAAAASDGRYTLGTRDVEVRGGVARLLGTATIAGSTLTQDTAVRAAVAAGMPLPEALRAATAVPAAAIGLGGELGRLAPSLRADAVLLDAELRVRAVWSSGVRSV